MINIFQFERKIKEKIDEDRQNDKDEKWREKYNVEREEMIKKYKKRIMQFIDNVAKKPRQKGDEYSRRLEVAEKSFYKSKILGDESIRIQHKFESDRVKEEEQKNKIYDTVPNEVLDQQDPVKLRNRDKLKEIVPPFRSQARGSMERLYDSMIDRGLSNNIDQIAQKSFQKKLKEHKEDPAKQMRKSSSNHYLTPRSFLPNLHDKTHFKAAYTIMLNSQSCLQDKYGKTLFVKNQEEILKNGQMPSQSLNISLARFKKNVSALHGINHGINRYNSSSVLKQMNNSDMTFNDRQVEANQSPSARNDESLVNILKGLDKQSPSKKQSQSILNFSKTLQKISSQKVLNNQLPLSARVQDTLEESPLDQLIQSYKGRTESTEDYLSYEYNEFKQKVQGKLLKKVQGFGEILTPFEEDKHKQDFERVQNKTKDMMQNCNYTRKKHFKSSTLKLGEGALFMNKGLTNRDYEENILKKSLS